MDTSSLGDKDLLYRLAVFFRKNEPFSYKEIRNAFKYIEEDRLRSVLAYLTETKAIKSCVGADNENIYWTSQLEVWTLISKEGRNQWKLRKRVDELLKAKVNPTLKDKYSKKEQVIRQEIEMITERIAAVTMQPDEFEPPTKKRRIIRTEEVIDAKNLQLRKELEDIEADIERWRQYVQLISNQLCEHRMVQPLQLVRMMGVDFGKARSYGVDIAFED